MKRPKSAVQEVATAVASGTAAPSMQAQGRGVAVWAQRYKTELWCVALGVVSMIAGGALVGRSLGDWRLPYMYEGDSLNVLAIAQTGIERLWASGSDRLGAPGALDLAYYPMPEYGQLFLIKVVSLFGLNAVETINGYFLLTFFFAGALGAWALVRLGLHLPLACLGGLAFTLLPCHFWRGTSHMFVNGFYLVPLMALVLLRPQAEGRAFWTYAAFCFLSPLINTYYTFFFCFLLVSMAAIDATVQTSHAPLKRAAKLLGFVAVGFVTNMLRSLPLYWQNKLGFYRPPQDSEIFGLKISLMVMPILNSLSKGMEGIYNNYMHSAPLINENKMNDLGLLVGCAFLFTLAYAFFGMVHDRTKDGDSPPHALLKRAGACVLLCIVYATVGGFSAMFSYMISPLIRSTNRIEVYIAFFSLAVTGLVVQHCIARKFKGNARRMVATAAAVGLGVVLLWDLSQRPLRPPLDGFAELYQRDAVFFQRLESALPTGARIFNLPYVKFPEGGLGAPDYDQFRPYLHTRNLVWSFAAIRDTDAAKANQQAESLLLNGQIDAFRKYLRDNQFSGILLDRRIVQMVRGNHEATLNANFGAPVDHDPIGEFVYYPVKR